MQSDPEASSQRKQKLQNFDPDQNGLQNNKGIFGLPFNTEESELVLLPVPWDATVSYGEGVLQGPHTILEASYQIDLYDEFAPGACQYGFAMDEISESWVDLSREFRAKAKYNIDYLEGKFDAPEQVRNEVYKELEEACEMLNSWVEEETLKLMNNGKLVGVVGGEHSVPLGYFHALDQVYDEYGVLQIDAHLDLRKAYQGFTYSHASIMYNALQSKALKKLVPVGVRDFSEKEMEFAREKEGQIKLFSDFYLQEQLFGGASWSELCDRIISELPQYVYISFDIDGLQPTYCPNTGTPVPGGLNFNQAAYLINKVVESGREIIGFDLCEVAPGQDEKGRNLEWDGNVGARMLYRLCCDATKSRMIE